MKLMRVGAPGAERPALLAEDGTVVDLSSITADIDGAFLGAGGIDRVRRGVANGALPRLEATGQRVGAPIARPGKVVCIGLNYRDHAQESGGAIPEEPVVFLKAPYTVVGPNDDVLIPRASAKTDWEVELAVVIGRTARYLDSPARAIDHIAGYAISNDVSEREFQLERSHQWDLGKSCETFNPLGPYLVTVDEIPNPGRLSLRTRVNGALRQDGNTENLIFDVPYLIWYLSHHMVLEPGDLINTGTPAGVALGLPGNPYLRPGDLVELEISGLGTQTQIFAEA
jgi:2-keto-4-pentenoate hydratase/2-oxohepta-3-ene-1,7-dioic acid hydratase in catechol pathway